MAQRKTASGASAQGEKPSVAELKKTYEVEQRALFETTKEKLKQLQDPSRNSSASVNQYTREQVRQYLQNVTSNSENLQKAARYLYYRSQIFFRIINWYAGMWDLRCRKVIPEYDLVKGGDLTKMLKSYNETLDWLDHYSLQENFFEVLVHCYLEDVCYAVFFRSEEGSFFYVLPPEECRIIGRYDTGDLAFAIDGSKWRNAQRRQIAEWIGSPFSDIIAEYDRTGNKWIQMPDEYAACFKFRIEDLEHVIVPFSSLVQSLVSLIDTEDAQAILTEQAIYRLIAVPMPLLDGSKQSDDFAITPDTLLLYYNKLMGMLPEYVAAAPVPGELTNDNVIDFSSAAAESDVDRLANSQDTLLSIAGGGAVLNASKINSNAAFAAWMQAETEFAISPLIGQIQGFTNRILSYDTSAPCRVEYFETSVYTRKDLIENLLKMSQHSFSDRLALQACLGFSEKSTLALEYLETQVLGLPEQMTHPLVSTYTQSGTDGEVGQGRDQIPDDELSDSGERSRNA